MRRRVLWCGLFLFAASASAHLNAQVAAEPGAQPSYQPSEARTLIRAGHVIDVHTGNELANETVVVQGDKIVALAKTADTPGKPGDRVVDLAQFTVLPGMIDVHVHLTMATNFDPYLELSMTPGKEAIIGVENAKTTLEAGFTTVRNGFVMRSGVIYKNEHEPATVDHLAAVAQRTVPANDSDVRLNSF